MLENLLVYHGQFVSAWYEWGVAMAFAITFVISLWIFFDSDSNHYYAPLWRLLSVLAAMAVIPSTMLSFFPNLAEGLGDPSPFLAYVGLVGVAISLVSFVLYTFGIRVFDPYRPETGMEYDFLPPPQEEALELPKFQLLTSASTRPTPPRSSSPVYPVPEEPDIDALLEAATRVIVPEPEPEPPQPLAWLVLMNGQRAGLEFKLGEKTDIGRGSKHNDIGLSDRAVSRQHARVKLEKEEFVIYDLASSNGVSVNNQLVQRRVLQHGDRIMIGESELGFMMVREEKTGFVRSESATKVANKEEPSP